MRLPLLPILFACALAALAPFTTAGAGDRDPTFGDDGRATTYKPAYSVPRQRPISTFEGSSMVIQPDGKIVVAGYAREFKAFGVARFLRDGTLDPTFYGKGRFHTSFPDTTFYDFEFDYPISVGLQTDGRLVVAGHGYYTGSVGDNHPGFALACHTSNGELDTTFGDNGRVFTRIGTYHSTSASCMVIQPDGGIIVGGQVHDFTEHDFPQRHINNHFVLARYDASGQLDSTFGDNGIVTTPIPFGDASTSGLLAARAIALQPNGKIVLTGDFDISPDIGAECCSIGYINADVAILRYNTDGTLDPTFGGTGIVTRAVNVGANDYASGIAIDHAGIYIAGSTTVTRQIEGRPNPVSFRGAFLLRYTRSGEPDSTFSENGKVISNFGGTRNGKASYGHAIALQPDGKILLAGSVGDSFSADFTLSRYTRDGALDHTFSHDGKVITRMPQPGGSIAYNFPHAVAVDADGNIVVAGTLARLSFQPVRGYYYHIGLVRYLGDPVR